MNTVINHHEFTVEAVIKNKDVYRAAFDLSNTAQAIISPGLNFIRANQEFCRVTGYSEADLTGLSVYDILHPTSRAETISHMGGDAAIDGQFIHRNGSVRLGRFRRHAVEEGDDTPLCIILSVEDITGHDLPPEETRLYERLYRHVIDESTDSIAFLDTDGHVVFMNGAGLVGLGASGKHAAVHSHYADLWDGTNSLAARASMILARKGILGRFDAFSSASGTPRWWEVRIIPIEDGDKGVIMMLAVSREMTALRREEERRQELEKRLALAAPEQLKDATPA